MLHGVSTVDEEQGEWGAPPRRDGRRTTDHRDDDVLQPGRVDGPTKERQRVDDLGCRVYERRIMPLPPGLVFLGAAVVVDADDDTSARLRCCPQPGCGLTAIATDFE